MYAVLTKGLVLALGLGFGMIGTVQSFVKEDFPNALILGIVTLLLGVSMLLSIKEYGALCRMDDNDGK